MPTVIAKTASWGPFTMRLDTPPFNDERVRMALKLIVDRKQMLEQVFAGYGQIGNDLFGILDTDFTVFPQREQDIDQAKSLLKQAGQEGLTIELITTENAPGQVPAAEVFATQAKLAGVTVKVTKQTPTDYFAKSYLNVPFSQDYWPYQPYLVTCSQATIKGAPYNATHQADDAYDKLYRDASAEPDAAKRKDKIHEMLTYDFEKGGNIIPYHFPSIDGLSPMVKGVTESAIGQSLGGFDFKHIWIDG